MDVRPSYTYIRVYVVYVIYVQRRTISKRGEACYGLAKFYALHRHYYDRSSYRLGKIDVPDGPLHKFLIHGKGEDMAKKTKLTLPDGRTVVAERMSIEASSEGFTDILLEDQTTIRLKVVATGAFLIEGLWDTSGDPSYLVNNQVLVSVRDCNENLRRTEQ